MLLYDTSTQFDEQRDQVAVEQILRVVFLDPERPTPVSRTEISLICHAFYNVWIISFFLLWRHWKNLSDSWLRRRLRSRHARSLQKTPVLESLGGKDLLSMNGWGFFLFQCGWSSVISLHNIWHSALCVSSFVERTEGKIPGPTAAGWRGRFSVKWCCFLMFCAFILPQQKFYDVIMNSLPSDMPWGDKRQAEVLSRGNMESMYAVIIGCE